MRFLGGILAFCLLVATPGSADMVMLLTGESLRGTFANRDTVREQPAAQAHISLLPEDSDELLRFELDEIDYLVFEDQGKREVIELSSLRSKPTLADSQQWTPEYREFRESLEPEPKAKAGKKGIPLIIVGAMTAGAGALIKFGDEKVTVTEDSIDYQENSYNALNYSLMIGGGAMLVIGIAIQVSESSSSPNDHAMLTLEPCVTPLSCAPAVGVALNF